MNLIPESRLRELSATAVKIRMDVLDMVYRAQTGHIGGAFSAAEILTALYFQHARLKPEDPSWSERDRVIFSKGHACAALYSALARKGFFPIEELKTFRAFDSILQGHPDPNKTPGVEAAAGPLGHGVAIGAGLALALRGTDRTNGNAAAAKPAAYSAPSSAASRARVYVVLGDGELDAGVVWEGMMTAAKYRLGNLCAIVDWNGITQTGATADTMPLDRLADRWESFGWHVQEVHGHNIAEILGALNRAQDIHAQPSVILARTTKGKGVSFMEYDHRWHGSPPTEAQYRAAKSELEATLGNLEKIGVKV